MKLTIQELFGRLHHKNARIRRNAAKTLDDLEAVDPGIVSQLIVFLGCDDATFRTQAARSLAVIGPKAKDAVPKLTVALSNDDSDLRFWALQALIAIGSAARPAVPRIIRLLRDEAFGIRQAAAGALATIAADMDATTPALIRTLQDDQNEFVRQNVVQALGKIGSRIAVAALIEGNRPVNCILPARLEFPETRGIRIGRQSDGRGAEGAAAGRGEGAALAADGAAVAAQRIECPRVLRLAESVGARVLFLAA